MEKIIFFDGICNLCNGAVDFVIRHAPKRKFAFAPFQSKAWEEVSESLDFEVSPEKTFILFDDERYYTRSSAALRVLKYLSWPYSFLYIFTLTPEFIRNPLYDFIARNRYRWFGKLSTCRIPTPEIEERFLA